MIKYMTPSRIDFSYQGREITVPGEALMRMPGEPDFIVYAAMIKGWLPPHSDEPLTTKQKIGIMAELRSNLAEKKIAFEIEDEDKFIGENAPSSIPSNSTCPKSGWWFTPAKAYSRRHFKQGDVFPTIEGSSYGDTYWQWSPDQSDPRP